MICALCPKKCYIDRSIKKGLCGADNTIKVARAAPHFWEEPCISGQNGSGTVFFSGCALSCVFCQNKKISQADVGEIVSKQELCDMFFKLKDAGCHNINLVTADHYLGLVLPCIKSAKQKGLGIPFVLNTSSYLNQKTVRALNGLIDVFIADFKFFNSATAKKYANSPDYPYVATAAIDEMLKICPNPVFKNGVMQKGVIVRVLVLPNNIIEAKQIIKHLYTRYGDNIFISVMSQFTPSADAPYPELTRTLTEREYKSVVDYAMHLNIKNAFIQSKDSASEQFIPNF